MRFADHSSRLPRLAFRIFLPVFFIGVTGIAATGQIETPDVHQPNPVVGAEDRGQVSLYLSLRDKKGRPVQDVRPGDFEIYDKGTPVRASDLHLASNDANGDHVITLLFGRMDPAACKNAASAARKLLKSLDDKSAVMAVWAVDNRLHVVQSYTRDRNLIERAVVTATTDRDTALLAAGTAQEKLLLAAVNTDAAKDERSSREKSWDRASFDTLNDAATIYRERHTPWAIASLAAAGEAQRSLRGRKALLYFAQEVPTDLNAADMLRVASQKLRDGSTSVYVIDMNPLDASVAQGMVASMAMGGMAAANHLNPAPALNGPASGIQGFLTPTEARQMGDTISGLEIDGTTTNTNLLGQLASSTGGGYVDADGNMKKLSHLFTAELSTYYTVSYPEAAQLDGNFHPVQFKPLRPGLKISTQPGYVAMPREAGASTAMAATDHGADMAQLAADATGSDLVFHTALLRFGKSAAGIRNVVAMQVPIQELALQEDPNTDLYALHATLAGEIKPLTGGSAAGAPVARFQEEFRRHGSTDSEDRVKGESLALEHAVSLPAGEYQMETILRDWNSNKIGRSTQTFHVTESDDAAAVSDLVLVGSTEASRGDEATLKYDHDRVIPNLNGNLNGDAAAALYFQLYPDAGSAKQKLQLEVAKDGKLVATLPMQVPALKAGEVSARVAHVKLPAAGSYELTLVLDRDGHVTRRHLSVTGAGQAEAAAATDADSSGATLMPASLEVDGQASSGRVLPAAEGDAMLATAREHALSYNHMLPNFLCVESIDRATDSKGSGVWKQRDTIVEMLRYVDKTETRTILEVNGRKSHLEADHIEGAHSNGEFGGILQTVFALAAAAEFHWVRTEERNGVMVQVFRYSVEQSKSEFYLSDQSGSQIKSALKGYVFVDNDTHAVRRLVAETTDLPVKFGIKASWMVVDYDYIGINGHDYLLPTRGEVGMKQGRHQSVLNQLRFSGYRRYGSHIRVLASLPTGANPE